MLKLGELLTKNKQTTRKDTSIADFIIGILLVGIGIYHIFTNTSIGVVWKSRLLGTALPSGALTIPILIGIVILLLNHRSTIGWMVIAVGIVILLIQIIFSLRISFNTTSLLDYFLMFGGTFGGLILLARGLLR